MIRVPRPRRTVPALALGSVLLVTTSACGGSSGSSAAATSSAAPSAAPSGGPGGMNSTAFAAYQKCLKKHGVTMGGMGGPGGGTRPSGAPGQGQPSGAPGQGGAPGAQPSGGARPSGAPGGMMGGTGTVSKKTAAALKACASLRPSMQAGPAGGTTS